MKYDKKIKLLIRDLKFQCDDYLEYIDSANECAYSDRKIESIIEKLKELKKISEKRFENLSTVNTKDKKGYER